MSGSLKSRVVALGPPIRFLEDLEALSRLPYDVLMEVIALVNESAAAGDASGFPDDDTLLPIAQSHNITVPEIRQALDAGFYVSSTLTLGDTVDTIIDDLIGTKKIPPSPGLKRKLTAFLENLTPEVLREAQAQAVIEATFPTLSFFDTNIAVTVSFGRSFNSERDTCETYKPELASRTPVVIVQLDIDRFGTKVRDSFALPLKQLSQLINHLELARHELTSLDNGPSDEVRT